MTVTQIVQEQPMTLSEVKAELEKIQKRDGELTFRGNKTLEYVQAVNPLGPKKAKELKDKLTALDVPRLKEMHVAKMVDVLPTSPNEVKMVLQAYTLTVKDEHCKAIADACKEYA